MSEIFSLTLNTWCLRLPLKSAFLFLELASQWQRLGLISIFWPRIVGLRTREVLVVVMVQFIENTADRRHRLEKEEILRSCAKELVMMIQDVITSVFLLEMINLVIAGTNDVAQIKNSVHRLHHLTERVNLADPWQQLSKWESNAAKLTTRWPQQNTPQLKRSTD